MPNQANGRSGTARMRGPLFMGGGRVGVVVWCACGSDMDRELRNLRLFGCYVSAWSRCGSGRDRDSRETLLRGAVHSAGLCTVFGNLVHQKSYKVINC